MQDCFGCQASLLRSRCCSDDQMDLSNVDLVASVPLVGTIVMLNYTFDWGPEGMTYADSLFLGTTTPNHSVAKIAGGELGVVLGAAPGDNVGPMSGGWTTLVQLDQQMSGSVTFDYQISHTSPIEPDEIGDVLFALDGNLIGTGGNMYIDRLVPPAAEVAASTGWKTVTIDLGILDVGMHSLSFGGYLSSRSATNEIFTFDFDNFNFGVTPTGQVIADAEPTPNAGTVLLSFADDVIKFGNSADNVGGGLGDDKLTGAGGDDIIFGADGADILSGGNHNDTLAGGTGNDVLRGGNGDDILWGGAGQDILHGDGAAGGGADVFCFSGNSVGAYDVIKDFDAAEGDKLDFSHLVSGFDAQTDQIKDYVKLQDLGLRTIVRVDLDGAGGTPGFVKVAVLHGVTGMDTVDQLFADGTLIL